MNPFKKFPNLLQEGSFSAPFDFLTKDTRFLTDREFVVTMILLFETQYSDWKSSPTHIGRILGLPATSIGGTLKAIYSKDVGLNYDQGNWSSKELMERYKDGRFIKIPNAWILAMKKSNVTDANHRLMMILFANWNYDKDAGPFLSADTLNRSIGCSSRNAAYQRFDNLPSFVKKIRRGIGPIVFILDDWFELLSKINDPEPSRNLCVFNPTEVQFLLDHLNESPMNIELIRRGFKILYRMGLAENFDSREAVQDCLEFSIWKEGTGCNYLKVVEEWEKVVIRRMIFRAQGRTIPMIPKWDPRELAACKKSFLKLLKETLKTRYSQLNQETI